VSLPDHRLRRAARRQVPAALRERRLVAIELSATELEQYYNSFANGVLWPTFHYSIDGCRSTTTTAALRRRQRTLRRGGGGRMARGRSDLGGKVYLMVFHAS